MAKRKTVKTEQTMEAGQSQVQVEPSATNANAPQCPAIPVDAAPMANTDQSLEGSTPTSETSLSQANVTTFASPVVETENQLQESVIENESQPVDAVENQCQSGRKPESVTLIPSPLGHGMIRPPWGAKNTANPAGRPPAGLVIKEWYNVMASSKWTARRVVAAWKDEDAPASKRAAAFQMMQTMGLIDLADLASVADGTESLKSAQRKGLPTHAIKKLKTRTRTDSEGNETVEREIELHPDRSGEALDRIADRTVGKPSQTSLIATVSLDPVQRASLAIEQARALLGLGDGVVRLA